MRIKKVLSMALAAALVLGNVTFQVAQTSAEENVVIPGVSSVAASTSGNDSDTYISCYRIRCDKYWRLCIL